MPAFYDRDSDGIPRRWLRIVQGGDPHGRCRASSARRMVKQYVEGCTRRPPRRGRPVARPSRPTSDLPPRRWREFVACRARRSPSPGARSAAPRRSPSPAARRGTAATAGTRRSPSRRSSRGSSRSSATSARTAPRSTSIYHSTVKRPCGQIIVVDDGYDLFLTVLLYPNFSWDEPAYHLEGDPEGRIVRRDPRRRRGDRGHRALGRGKWHLEISGRWPPSRRTGTARCNAL